MGTITFGSVLLYAQKPLFKVNPTISGTFSAGQTLTYNTGSWRASPSTVTTRIDTFIDGVQEGGYGADTYILPVDKSGGTIQIGVNVTNTQGSTYALSPVYNISELNLSPPFLSSDTADTATTKVITIAFGPDVSAGDVLDLEYSSNSDMSSATTATYTVLPADELLGSYDWSVAGQNIGTRYFRVRNTRGVVDGAYSDILSKVVVPSAPITTITSLSSDNTPTARVSLNADHIETYIIRTEWSTTSDFQTVDQFEEHTIDAGDVTATYYDSTATAVADGQWFVRSYVRASASLIGPWSNIDSETIATVVTSGAPVIADQTIRFGQNTLSGAGGKMLVNTGGAVDGTGTCTISGNVNFTINSTTGMITPTGTRGKANPLPASGTATITYVNAFGSDSATVTIECEADAYDYRTTTELTNAINNARPGTNGDSSGFTTDYIFYQVEGTVAGGSTDSFYIRGKTLAGTMTEPNDGVTTVAGYNRSASVAVSGGSLTITCRTNRGATFLPKIFCTGSGPLVIDGLIIGGANSTGTNSAANTTYQINATQNANWPAASKFAVINCTLGGTAIGTTQAYWTRTGTIDKCDIFVFEDNIINGAYAGLKVTDTGIFTYRRNAVRKITWDHIFYNMGYGADITASFCQMFISDNTLWDRARPIVVPGQHADSFQSGVAEQVDNALFNNKPLQRVVVGNIWDFSAENLGSESYNQGFFEAYFNQLYTATTGEIAYNLLICEAPNGLTLSASTDTNVFNNTLIFNTNAVIGELNAALVRGGQWSSSTGSTWTNNIFCGASAPFDEGSGMTHSGTVRVDALATAVSATSYESMFDGPFVRENDATAPNGNRPTFAYDETSEATVRADLISMFTPKAGGGAVGKGFTIGI